MNFGIIIFPPKEVQDAANSYRKRYDPHYSLIQPHMTVREAEPWNEEKLSSALHHLGGVTSRLQPVTVRINRFSTFYPTNNVIYMALEDPEPFRDLQTQICSGVLEEKERRFSFHPHLTIGQNLGDEEMHDVFSSLRPKPLDFTFRIDRIHLMYQTDNMAWTAHQTFLFCQ